MGVAGHWCARLGALTLAVGAAMGADAGQTPAPAWLPRPGFDLIAIDKVTGRSEHLTGKSGAQVGFGSLTITVKSCLVRPPDRPADATAWLDIMDSHPDQPGFHGWMFVSDPSVSMMQHPLYDIRLAGCRES
jgi:hypothetical protein